MDFTERELMVIAAAREIRDDDLVFVGMRLPLIAFAYAKRTHAPGATGLFENGVVRVMGGGGQGLPGSPGSKIGLPSVRGYATARPSSFPGSPPAPTGFPSPPSPPTPVSLRTAIRPSSPSFEGPRSPPVPG